MESLSASVIGRAQNHDPDALEQVISTMDHMAQPIFRKYHSKNVLVDIDDLKSAFYINILSELPRVRLDVGDPAFFLFTQAKNKTIVHITKQIKNGTEQHCNRCGQSQKLHYTTNTYICSHPEETCECNATIYKTLTDSELAQSMSPKSVVPARFVGSDGQLLCRRVKSLNKAYFCARDYDKFLQRLIQDCLEHKVQIVQRLLDSGVGLAAVQQIFSDGLKLNVVQGFHGRNLPEHQCKFKDMLTRVKLFKHDKRLICTKCGGFDISTNMIESDDEMISDTGGKQSRLADYTPDGVDHFKHLFSIFPPEQLDEFVTSLFGREHDIMSMLFMDDMGTAAIAEEFDIGFTSISKYKTKVVSKLIVRFYDILVEEFGLEAVQEAMTKHKCKLTPKKNQE